MLLACSRQLPAASAGGDGYSMTVSTPAPARAGDRVATTIRVVPKSPYKINLEYPLKLKVSGPAAATPRQLEQGLKQATRLTKAELLMRPEFKLGAAGRHLFQGTLRFSVCTEAQCEIKTEKLSWTVVVH